MNNKQKSFWIVLLLAVYLVLESLCFLGLIVLKKTRNIKYEPADAFTLMDSQKEKIRDLLEGNNKYLTFDSDLGWSLKANGRDGKFRSNAQGLRADREYALEIPVDKIRITAFGDSYTHGDEVPIEETWPFYLEQLDPRWEVLNFGVPGYGLDQAYLRYQKTGTQFETHIVLIGFFSADIFRHVNTFRPFYGPTTGIPLAKPRFLIKNNRIEQIDNPVQSLSEYRRLLTYDRRFLKKVGTHDYYYSAHYRKGPWDFLPSVRMCKLGRHSYRSVMNKNFSMLSKGEAKLINRQSEAFMTTLAIMDMFYNEVEANNDIPVIVILPTVGDVVVYQRDGIKNYAPLLDILDRAGLFYFDILEEVFADNNEQILKFFKTNHYSGYGNRMVAEAIDRALDGILAEKSE